MTLEISLMVIGLSTTATGIYLYLLAKSKAKSLTPILPNPPIEHTQKIDNQIFEQQISEPITTKQDNTTILNSLIQMATTDGILTENEKKLLQNKATELGLNYDDFAEQITQALEATENEVILIDKKKAKGDDFEEYIARKFDRKYFTIEQWTSDKYVQGIYVQANMYPDLQIIFRHKEYKVAFAIECKYRSDYFKNGIEIGTDKQLNNYQNFAIDKQIPVFVTIGVGGNPQEPNELYIINLSLIESAFLTKEFLSKYQKRNFKDNNFFFDPMTKVLR